MQNTCNQIEFNDKSLEIQFDQSSEWYLYDNNLLIAFFVNFILLYPGHVVLKTVN